MLWRSHQNQRGHNACKEETRIPKNNVIAILTMRKADIKVGQRFGRLTILQEEPVYVLPSGRRKRYFLCRCDCGNEISIRLESLAQGKTISCGCYRSEKASTHRLTHHPLYGVWRDMRSRCDGRNKRSFHNYGERGIKVCDEWKNSFESFYEWCINNGYRKGLTLDRIDVDDNYSPENCRFVTMKVQQNNKRNNLFYVIDGNKKTLTEWCNIYKINFNTVRKRLNKGMDILLALTVPPNPKFRTRLQF